MPQATTSEPASEVAWGSQVASVLHWTCKDPHPRRQRQRPARAQIAAPARRGVQLARSDRASVHTRVICVTIEQSYNRGCTLA